MTIENLSQLNSTLDEMSQNCYDLLGDIIAVQCLCGCENLQDFYPTDVIVCYRHRIADYIRQHSSEIATLSTRAAMHLKPVEDTIQLDSQAQIQLVAPTHCATAH